MCEANGICKRCADNFTAGYNCAESILLAFSDYLGLEKHIIPRIATPFGGGLALKGCVCGALSGAIMVLGIKYGREEPTQEKEPSYSRAASLIDKFSSKYGTINCKEITGLDFSNQQEVAQKWAYIRETICTPLVKEVSQWLLEELE